MKHVFLTLICLCTSAGAVFAQSVTPSIALECQITAICEQQEACAEVGPFPLPMTPREGGYTFITPNGEIIANWADNAQEDFLSLIIPLQNGSWGSMTIFKGGEMVLTSSTLQQGTPYSSQAFGTCVPQEKGN